MEGLIMRVYLAGPSSELVRVKSAAALIEQAGHFITERWWDRIEAAARAGWTHDAEVPPGYMADSAMRNRSGIVSADAVVALAREGGGFSSGVAGEIGYAIAERDNARIERGRKRIILVGNCRGFVWSWLIYPNERVATIDEAIARLAHVV